MNLIPFPRVSMAHACADWMILMFSFSPFSSYTFWCPVMPLSMILMQSILRKTLYPSWQKRGSNPWSLFLIDLHIIIVCSTARTYSWHATLALGKSYPQPKIHRLNHLLLSRYLTAATIFRGDISSREVSASGSSIKEHDDIRLFCLGWSMSLCGHAFPLLRFAQYDGCVVLLCC